ncbi:ABC transporter substrate-binding protein [Dendronalium sp. ChiSLP03b]|uniref:ABC transporter substrate-binding protein n=1 Tax=Dendronalium sp. ChiSLP03b TaxID=3075381 RepID=UPI002AD3C335|nr:ABC transporter substrate-binding protein [Dendronalium sp. ChiSLP03b]MDZ8208652.1 ABC transporter substrate-binding protein [Dendronalium sp. ChiSLP03b]
MSQKNETAVLALALVLTVGIVGVGAWWFANQNSGGNLNILTSNQKNDSNLSIQERMSFGEKTLITGDITPLKKEGIQALAAQNYAKAITNLESSLKLKLNDPEAVIYLNNARIGSGKNYTIVASLPVGTDPNVALEILRGIAQAQNEVNTSGAIKGVPLKVGIANDNDNPAISKQIAVSLVKNQQVLGVVGPNTSDATLAAGDIYNAEQLVAISPTSTSVKISNFSRYVFRTVPSDFMAARSLANYMVKKIAEKKCCGFLQFPKQL